VARPKEHASPLARSDRGRCEVRYCDTLLVERGDRMIGTLTLACPACERVAMGTCACGCGGVLVKKGPNSRPRFTPTCAKRRAVESTRRYQKRNPRRCRQRRRRWEAKAEVRARRAAAAKARRDADPVARKRQADAARKRRRSKAGRALYAARQARKGPALRAAAKAWRLANPDRVKANRARYLADPDARAREAAGARRRRAERKAARLQMTRQAPHRDHERQHEHQQEYPHVHRQAA
jgi:hypothetical protein